MTLLKQIDKYFSLLLLSSILLGFTFPNLFLTYEGYVIYIIMAILGFLYLKVDIIDVVTHIKKPKLMLYILFINLLFSPLLIFFLFKSLDTNFLVAITLLAALPAGVTSAAFTDIMKGKTSLTLSVIILSNLLSIVTIPFLFWVLFNQDIQMDYVNFGFNLLKVFLIPFLIAKLCKRVFIPNLTKKLTDYYNLIIILLLCGMVTISISFQAEFIIENIHSLLPNLGIIFIIFFLLQLVAYFSIYWLKKGEKIAISNANMIMNNVLGIVLSIAFFNETVVTYIILSLVPWNTMIILKHWYKRYFP